MHEATQRELRCVLVIHGKGLNSRGGEAVLRKLTRHWLTQHPLVLGYCDAPAKDGGSGAVLVLLKDRLLGFFAHHIHQVFEEHFTPVLIVFLERLEQFFDFRHRPLRVVGHQHTSPGIFRAIR